MTENTLCLCPFVFSLLTGLLLSLPPLLLLLLQSVLLPAGATLLVSWNDGAVERTLEETVLARFVQPEANTQFLSL